MGGAGYLTRLEGWVDLDIVVGADGKVTAARVVDAEPKGVFDAAAFEAIRQWRFAPSYSQGRAVEQRAELRMRFRIERPQH